MPKGIALAAALLLTLAFVRPAAAVGPDELTFKADVYRTNLDTKLTHAEGNVEVKMGRQTLWADTVEMQGNEGKLHAEGHVRFAQGPLKMEGVRADSDMKTGFGTFQDAVVRLENFLYLEGRSVSRVSDDVYEVRNGKISTCLNCPQDWSVVGSFIRAEVEGYAEIHHALFQIHDVPVAYFPFFVLPIKSKRQSGFLVPQYAHNQLGNQFIIPYFWAINRESDATFAWRYMTEGGNRLESEYRYRFSNRSGIDFNGSYLRKKANLPGPNDRYGFSMREKWQITPHLMQRFRGELAGDTRYTVDFDRDFIGNRQSSLINEPSLTWTDDNFTAYALARFHRDNLPRELSNPALPAAHRGEIHNLPDVEASLPAKPLFGPLLSAADLHYMSFRRRGGPVESETGWIRTGDRTTLLVRSAAPMDLGSFVKWEPALELRGDFYTFSVPGQPASAARGRVFVDQKLSTEIFRVFHPALDELKAVKHSVSPYVRMSYAPPDAKTDHVFFNQHDDIRNVDSPKFDLFDPNSEAARTLLDIGLITEEQRLRPHGLLSYGLATRVVGRYGETNKTYEEFFGAKAEQDFDMGYKGDKDPSPIKTPFSRLRISAFGAYGGARLSTELAIDVIRGDTDMRNVLSFDRPHYVVSAAQTIGAVTRDYSVSGALRDIGNWSFSAEINYSDIRKLVTSQIYKLNYLKKEANCWRFELVMQKLIDQDNGRAQFLPYIGFVITEGPKGLF